MLGTLCVTHGRLSVGVCMLSAAVKMTPEQMQSEEMKRQAAETRKYVDDTSV